jgi:hypothetical protein
LSCRRQHRRSLTRSGVKHPTIEGLRESLRFALALEIDMPTASRSAEGDGIAMIVTEPVAHISQLLTKIAIKGDFDNEQHGCLP